ncbi:hypothetical protein [Wenjunlia tyrosinilytica]|uniref:Uncharacterized protein n=1 Tax=Wenjunlia tyrosinilytica TaxID=1544741 RepID=A0A917ZP83_9ACTN|nr:hypothetical protein [Wenjunlia tyrosinilytica]GGO88558.1 hypothetical protein GCM10012280_29670 [Wenjunlia tyrosinilytica]
MGKTITVLGAVLSIIAGAPGAGAAEAEAEAAGAEADADAEADALGSGTEGIDGRVDVEGIDVDGVGVEGVVGEAGETGSPDAIGFEGVIGSMGCRIGSETPSGAVGVVGVAAGFWAGAATGAGAVSSASARGAERPVTAPASIVAARMREARMMNLHGRGCGGISANRRFRAHEERHPPDLPSHSGVRALSALDG